MPDDSYLQIGPFSERVGVNAELLRAWERRYGLPQPIRTNNGRRLYTEADARRVIAMRLALERGLPAAEAARHAATQASPPAPPAAPPGGGELADLKRQLAEALTRLDEEQAQEHLDRLFGAYSIDTALG